MSVINADFSILNTLRPANAGFGEVVCIELRELDAWNSSNASTFLGYSKRKSISVPPSSNAYWNWIGLRSLLVAWCSKRGITRQARLNLYQMLNDHVRAIHLYELEGAYGHEHLAYQYWVIAITHLSSDRVLMERYPNLCYA